MAGPFELIAVNPRDVRLRCLMHFSTQRERGSKFHDWGKVLGGDWDREWRGRRNFSIVERPTYRAVHDRYVTGVPWEATGILDTKMAVIEERGEVDGCTSREQLVERYRRVDRVFEDIRRNGFRLSQEVDGTFSNLFVSIGRDGSLLRAEGGNHRLAMAMVLGLPVVPAYVMTRHSDWQRIRDRLAGPAPEGATDDRPRHPDLEGPAWPTPATSASTEGR